MSEDSQKEKPLPSAHAYTVDAAPGALERLFKAHHDWGHKGSKNSKRKTLRTHRDGSRRDFRLRN